MLSVLTRTQSSEAYSKYTTKECMHGAVPRAGLPPHTARGHHANHLAAVVHNPVLSSDCVRLQGCFSRCEDRGRVRPDVPSVLGTTLLQRTEITEPVRDRHRTQGLRGLGRCGGTSSRSRGALGLGQPYLPPDRPRCYNPIGPGIEVPAPPRALRTKRREQRRPRRPNRSDRLGAHLRRCQGLASSHLRLRQRRYELDWV